MHVSLPWLPLGPKPFRLCPNTPQSIPAAMLLILLSITCKDARVRNWRYKIGVPSCSELTSVCSLLHLRWRLQSDCGWQGVTWSCTWPLLNLISSHFCLCLCLCQQWLLAVPWTSNKDHWIWCSVCLEPFPPSYWHNFLLHSFASLFDFTLLRSSCLK